MNKSKQQFEEWAIKHNYVIERSGDTYVDFEAKDAWESWKASRESLEIELPDASDYDSGCPNYHDGYNTAMSRAYDELISNGVKIKNE